MYCSSVSCNSTPPKKLPVKSLDTKPIQIPAASNIISDTSQANSSDIHSSSSIKTETVSSNGVSDIKPNLCRVAPSVNSINGGTAAVNVIAASASSPHPASSNATATSSDAQPFMSSVTETVSVVNGTCDANHNMTSQPAFQTASKAATSSQSSGSSNQVTSPGAASTASASLPSPINKSCGGGDRLMIEGKALATSKPVKHHLLSDSDDVFNADIVCVHGNLRVEERCKQLISREVWFRLCTYFQNPTTFQFGKLRHKEMLYP